MKEMLGISFCMVRRLLDFAVACVQSPTSNKTFLKRHIVLDTLLIPKPWDISFY